MVNKRYHSPLVEGLASGVDAALGPTVGDKTGAALKNQQSAKQPQRGTLVYSGVTHQEGSHTHSQTNSQNRCHLLVQYGRGMIGWGTAVVLRRAFGLGRSGGGSRDKKSAHETQTGLAPTSLHARSLSPKEKKKFCEITIKRSRLISHLLLSNHAVSVLFLLQKFSIHLLQTISIHF